MKKILAAFLAVILLIQVGTILPNGIIQEASAHHQQLIFFPSGLSFATFDANVGQPLIDLANEVITELQKT